MEESKESQEPQEETKLAISNERWEEAQVSEKRIWDKVLSDNTLISSTDLYSRYFKIMGLSINCMIGKTVIDIGGGPLSMMFHHPELIEGKIVDPIQFDEKWIDRYSKRNILYVVDTGENFLATFDHKKRRRYDEVWIYNTLQHVQNPDFILHNLWKVADYVRLAEPCDTPIEKYHPHIFTKEWINRKLSLICDSYNYAEKQYDFLYAGGHGILKKHG